MIRCTLGFVFTPDLQSVLLIHKNRPDWQVGKINGLGGKIEGNETAQEGISREVEEEANINIPAQKWTKIAVMTWQEWQVEVLTTIYKGEQADAIAQTDEQIEWFKIKELPEHIISNLSWLIPLCKDSLVNKLNAKIVIEYE